MKEIWHSWKAAFGKIPLCNRKPERAPHIFGVCFPLCWRCCSIIVLMIITGNIFSGTNRLPLGENWSKVVSAMILLLPCVIDAFFQYILNRNSNNLRRIITGGLAGIGFAILIFQCISYLNRWM